MGILITDSTGKILKDARSGDISGGYRSPEKKKKKKKKKAKGMNETDVERLQRLFPRTFSDADRKRAEEMFIKRNDGGIARKTRTF